MRLPQCPIEQIGESGIEIDLDEYGDGQQHDHQRLGDNLLALKREEHHQCRKQSHQGDRLEDCKEAAKGPLVTLGQQMAPDGLRDNDRNDDVEGDRQQQRLPRDRDGGKTEKQRDVGHEGKDHQYIVQFDLREGEMRLAVGELAPYEDRCGTRCGGKDDEPGDV